MLCLKNHSHLDQSLFPVCTQSSPLFLFPDVYSYAVVLNELVRLEAPYSEQKSGVMIMYEVVNSGLRPQIHPQTPAVLRELITQSFLETGEL